MLHVLPGHSTYKKHGTEYVGTSQGQARVRRCWSHWTFGNDTEETGPTVYPRSGCDPGKARSSRKKPCTNQVQIPWTITVQILDGFGNWDMFLPGLSNLSSGCQLSNAPYRPAAAAGSQDMQNSEGVYLASSFWYMATVFTHPELWSISTAAKRKSQIVRVRPTSWPSPTTMPSTSAGKGS